MFLINIHQFDIVLAQPVRLAALKNQVDDIWCIFRLQCQDVFVLCSAEHFCERGKVDPESNVSVASEGREAFGLEHHRDKSNMRIVHGLKSDSRVIAVEVAVLDEVFYGIDNLCSD